MSETSLNTGEMLFQLRVWDYLAWALDDMAYRSNAGTPRRSETVAVDSGAQTARLGIRQCAQTDRQGTPYRPTPPGQESSPIPKHCRQSTLRSLLGRPTTATSQPTDISPVWKSFAKGTVMKLDPEPDLVEIAEALDAMAKPHVRSGWANLNFDDLPCTTPRQEAIWKIYGNGELG